jgi:hypothetical protein
VRLGQLFRVIVGLTHLSHVDDALLLKDPLHHTQIVPVYSGSLSFILMVMQTLTDTRMEVPGDRTFFAFRLTVYRVMLR